MTSREREKGTPAVQIYPGDYLSDDDIDALPDDDYGRFWRVLLRDWKQIGIPSDHSILARWLRLRPQKFAAFWAKVGHRFVERDGRYYWPPFDLQREQQAMRSQQARDAIESRWNKARTPAVLPGAYETDTAVSSPLYSSSSSSVVASASSARARDPEANSMRAAIREVLSNYPGMGSIWDTPAEPAFTAAVFDVLARFGVTYYGDPKLKSIVGEIGAALDGLHGPQMSVAEIQRNLQDFLTAPDLRPSGKVLRGFLYSKERDRSAKIPPQSRSQNGTPPDALVVEAQQVFQRILSLRVRDERNEYIPAVRVKEIGRAAWTAYETIGGASALLSATGRDTAFLLRDFTRAYVVASNTPSPAPSPSPEHADDATTH